MTAFAQHTPMEDAVADFEPTPPPPAKRPSRWSLTNWPVRGKVLAIALVPLVLAAVFGGMRIYTSTVTARDLRLAADRAELIPAIESYMSALEGVVVTGTEGGDTEAARLRGGRNPMCGHRS